LRRSLPVGELVARLKLLEACVGCVQLASKKHVPPTSLQQEEQGPAAHAPLPSQVSSVHRSRSRSQAVPVGRGTPTHVPLEQASLVWHPLAFVHGVSSASMVHAGVQQVWVANPASHTSPASRLPFRQRLPVKFTTSPAQSMVPVSAVPDGFAVPSSVQVKYVGGTMIEASAVKAPVVGSIVPPNSSIPV